MAPPMMKPPLSQTSQQADLTSNAVTDRLSAAPLSMSTLVDPSADSAVFLRFNYPELRDLGKHFLTISSATTVFLLTFVDKLIKPNGAPSISMKVCLVSLAISIAAAGIGLFTNYVAGSGASGAIIWGVGKNFRAFTIATYLLNILAGGGLLFAFALLAHEALSL